MTNVDTRVWITRKRQEVVEQMDRLQAKLSVYDDLLRDLPVNLEEPRIVLVDKASADAMLNSKERVLYVRRKKRAGSEARRHTVDLALEAAGEKGITARQLAEVASIPIGTASSHLTIRKAEGTVRHDPTLARYFAVHSTQEDNNTDQGGVPLGSMAGGAS